MSALILSVFWKFIAKRARGALLNLLNNLPVGARKLTVFLLQHYTAYFCLGRECPTIAMLMNVKWARSAQSLRGKLALLGGEAWSGGAGLFLWLDKKKPRARGESRGFGFLIGGEP